MIRRLLVRLRLARPRMPRWYTATVNGGPVHVVPFGDLVEHRLHEECVCGPTPEAVFRDDGSNGWLITHHSLDGREAHE